MATPSVTHGSENEIPTKGMTWLTIRSVVKFHCKADILFPHARGLLLAGTSNILPKTKLSCRMLKEVVVGRLPAKSKK